MKYIIFFLLLSVTNCSSQKNIEKNNLFLDKYFLKDFEKDSVLGISLEKSLDYLKNKNGEEIVIAVIDSDIDINHEGIKDMIWKNPKEIPNNNIDDDDNGYIDDIHGWNFIRNKNGDHVIFGTSSAIEFIQGFKNNQQQIKDSVLVNTYQNALKENNKEIQYLQKKIRFIKYIEKYTPKCRKITDSILHKKDYAFKELDSLNEIRDKKFKKTMPYQCSRFMWIYYKYEDQKNIDYWKPIAKLKLTKTSNINFNDRLFLGDSINNINDINYGSNVVNSHLDKMWHGTTVSGVLSNFKNIKIMCLVISPKYGDRKDKDIALSIRYAVDNGANIIDYSAGKKFSFNSHWIQEALAYAELNNVLFIKAPGNSYLDVDVPINNDYPKQMYKTKELNNFILVGATDKILNKNLIAPFSNYGEHSVHLFAPGKDITTTKSLGGYYQDSGTSMSVPMVGGTAALIMSYYPNLKVKQVKDIILNSVSKYDIDAEIKISKRKTKMVPFSKLSRTGGILNTYQALKLAEKISKETK